MINIKNFSEINPCDVAYLWNEEVGFIYPITEQLFDQNVTGCEYFYSDASFVATQDDKIVGFIISKIWNDDRAIESYKTIGWISLFYVSRKHRMQGIGSTLLAKAEMKLREKGITTIHLGRDVNNFFPGIPCDFDNLTAAFMEKRGYVCGRRTYDLIRYDLSGVSEYMPKNSIRFAEKEDLPEIINFFDKNFPGRWQYDAKRNFIEGLYRQYLLAFDKKTVIGFMRMSLPNDEMRPYSLTWYARFKNLGGIGPLGVDKDYRKKGVFNDLINYGLYHFKNIGIKEVIIDWTGLISLYQKYGFEIWKVYQYASKELV